MIKLRFLVVTLVAACGGDKSPVEKCDDLIDLVCDRLVECVPGSATHSDCVDAIESQIPCGRARMVSATYDRCMEQLDDNSCAALFPPDQNGQPSLVLPADCNNVILVRPASGVEPRWEPASRALASLPADF